MTLSRAIFRDPTVDDYTTQDKTRLATDEARMIPYRIAGTPIHTRINTAHTPTGKVDTLC